MLFSLYFVLNVLLPSILTDIDRGFPCILIYKLDYLVIEKPYLTICLWNISAYIALYTLLELLTFPCHIRVKYDFVIIPQTEGNM
jgi:hypothetical protein